MSDHQSVEIINIGDELLIGLRQNSHLVYLGEQLRQLGLTVSRTQIIRDQASEIVRAIREASSRSHLVITTGGLGPTSDDTTREAVAEFLGEELLYDPEIEEGLRSRFNRMGRAPTENNLKQCYRPVNSTILPNHWGTAPGLLLPLGKGKWLAMLPGPTHELQPIFKEVLIPELRSQGIIQDQVIKHIRLRCCGLGESLVEDLLQPVVSSHPEIQFAFCAHNGIVDVRLHAMDPSRTWDQLTQVAEKAQLRLGENCFSVGDDCPACALVKQLACWDRTLAIAESCTGGLLASAFTDVPGASKVFAGSVVCYTDDSKIQLLDVPECLLKQHGAVSAESAVAMATAAAEKFSTDYGLSITGFAGPGGGTPENPVGTIYIAHHSPSGVWAKKIYHPAERTSVKARAVNEALDWMRRKIYERRIEDALALHDESSVVSSS